MTRDEALRAALLAWRCKEYHEDANAAFLASLAASGFALVPIEPTDKMLCALCDEWDSVGRRTMWENYQDMIAAAQEDNRG